jgi:hypothetical protein
MKQIREAEPISARIGRKQFRLDAARIKRKAQEVLPEPLRDHYAVVAGRRYPPKQIISLATGLDRADFTTHQARRVLQRLGFSVGRRSNPTVPPSRGHRAGPHGGAEAELLRPYAGQWVAQRGMEVLVSASSPEEVLRWLERYDERADAMFRVPDQVTDATGAGPF